MVCMYMCVGMYVCVCVCAYTHKQVEFNVTVVIIN